MMHQLGTHLLLDLWGIGAELLDDETTLEECLVEAARLGGARVLESRFNRFDPHGVSGVVIIAESHITLHTWPELGFAAVDIFTCGSPDVSREIGRQVISALNPGGHRVRDMRRGLPALDRPSPVAEA